jgi:hypothetical protein
LWKLYVTVIIGTSVGVGIVFGVVVVSHGRAADVVPGAVRVTIAACVSPFYLRRRLARVAHANRLDQ